MNTPGSPSPSGKSIIDIVKSGLNIAGNLVQGKPPDPVDFFESLYTLREDPWNYTRSPYERDKYAQTLAMIPHQEYKKILEVGCGEGVFTRLLAERMKGSFSRIRAVDISPTAIERAKNRAPKRNTKETPAPHQEGEPHPPLTPPPEQEDNIEFVCMNITRESPGEGFDLIICSEVLYYYKENEIQEIGERFIKWMKRGGFLLLVHMRRLSDDTRGFPPSPVNYPPFGANTVHSLFKQNPKLKLAHENQQPMYIISLFQSQ